MGEEGLLPAAASVLSWCGEKGGERGENGGEDGERCTLGYNGPLPLQLNPGKPSGECLLARFLGSLSFERLVIASHLLWLGPSPGEGLLGADLGTSGW